MTSREEWVTEHAALISDMDDRQLMETVYMQNAEILRLLAEGIGTLQAFQNGGMGKMLAGMFSKAS